MNLPKAEELDDIKNLHALEFPWRDYAMAGAALLAVLLFCLLFYRIWKARTSEKTDAQPLPAPAEHWGVAVQESLRRLESKKPIELEELRTCYFELSALLRLILEKFLKTNMTELTSREICERLSEFGSSAGLFADAQEVALRVKEYFARVDLLLFAKQNIGHESYAGDCLWIRDLFSKALKLEQGEANSSGLENDSKVKP